MTNMTLGATLQRLRKAKGLSVAKLSKEINMSQSYLYDIEHSRRTPSAAVLTTLATFFGVTLDYLMGRTSAQDIKKEAPSQTAESLKRLPFSDVTVAGLPKGKTVKVPLLSPEMTACCGGGIPVIDITNGVEKTYEYTIEELGGVYDEMRPPVALRADGSCLERSRIFDGDILIINPAKAPHQWEPCVICWHGTLSAKRVVQMNGGIVKLYSDNDEYTVPANEASDPDAFYIWGPIVDRRGRPLSGM